MKKILLFAIVVFSCFQGQSQIIQKGEKILGGSFGLSVSNYTDSTSIGGYNGKSRSYQFAVNPSYGFARKDNHVIGVSLYSSYDTWKRKDLNGKLLADGRSWGAGPGVFYERIFPLGKSFYFSAVSALHATYGREKSDHYTNSTSVTQVEGWSVSANLGLTPKIGYVINKRWLVEASTGEFASINYRHSNYTTTGTSMTESNRSTSLFSLNTRFFNNYSLSNLGFSFRYKLNK